MVHFQFCVSGSFAALYWCVTIVHGHVFVRMQREVVSFVYVSEGFSQLFYFVVRNFTYRVEKYSVVVRSSCLGVEVVEGG